LYLAPRPKVLGLYEGTQQGIRSLKVPVNVRTLPEARFGWGVNRGQGVPRAFGKVVWRWPPGFAEDAGSMQIQLWERIGVSRGEAASWSTAPHAARQETGKRRAGIGRSDVEEAAHKNLFRSEAEGCEAPRQARESWM